MEMNTFIIVFLITWKQGEKKLLIKVMSYDIHLPAMSVTQCYVGVLDIYMNPNSLTMFDMSEVQTYKLMDCDKAHYPREIIQ
jgi:hypothetical protein